MASKVMKTRFVKNVLQYRGYAQACPASKPGSASASSVLPNKVFVASQDNGEALTRVSISFKAGSRYEPKEEQGLSHVLRNSAGLTTRCANAFILQRQLQQFGATVSASVDREIFTYTLEVTRDKFEDAIHLLNTIALETEYRQWELNDDEARFAYEIAGLAPQVRAVDLLHKAAFREGLGNSLFISPRRIGNVSTESLQHFVCENFIGSRCAITGVGISQDRLLAVAQNLKVNEGSGPSEKPAVFKSGELRKEIGGPLAHVAIAVSGAKANSKDTLAFAILSRSIGVGPATKWGNDNSPLGKAVGSDGVSAAVSGFNVSYSDAGLFGVLLSTSVDNADKAVKGAVGVLKNITSLDKFAIERGRNQLLTDILSTSSSDLSEQLGAQGLYVGQLRTPSDIADEVAKISDADVSNASKKIASSKPALAAVGNLKNVPYLDEL